MSNRLDELEENDGSVKLREIIVQYLGEKGAIELINDIRKADLLLVSDKDLEDWQAIENKAGYDKGYIKGYARGFKSGRDIILDLILPAKTAKRIRLEKESLKELSKDEYAQLIKSGT